MTTITCKNDDIFIEGEVFTACGGAEGEYVINTQLSAKKIKQFCEYYAGLSEHERNLLNEFVDFGQCRGNDIKGWVDNFLDVENPILMMSDLANDATYLNLDPLLGLCVRYLAFQVQTLSMEEIANIGTI